LKLVDKDEHFTYSPIASVQINCVGEQKLVVYPNPVNNQVYIKSSKQIESVSLLSFSGQTLMRKIYRQSQVGTIQLPLKTQLSQGIYLLRVVATDGTVQYTKLLKE
jgi:hypothetical protein